jgi:hypothetical protein
MEEIQKKRQPRSAHIYVSKRARDRERETKEKKNLLNKVKHIVQPHIRHIRHLRLLVISWRQSPPTP